ncbi:MAG: putative acyl-CoA dehydrogenase FadE10 [Candidatus Omnitrophica bacterium]|nr:putative acyl-CoA dehydrogenase FadE10 [Candidatus Omnitrophota bacterium]
MELLKGKENAEKAKSLEVAEDSREEVWKHPSFVGDLFQGKVRWELISPFPAQSAEDKAIGDAFLAKLGDFLKRELDADAVDRTGIIPDKVYKGLAELGCFGMKIPKEYGGLGLSQTNYNRAIGLVASHCGSTAVLLSAHQSIGVPQPLKMFGTPEQKKKYLPLFAKGAISAFALTEPNVGSDPAKMSTTATPTPDGQHYVINGDKLWCTNGPIADILIVMAKTPPKIVRGKEKTQITAFIVEKGTPGFEIVHRCKFMGLNGIQNGLLRFKDVKVPRENIVWGEGQGLKLALITLNTGRLTVPAACAAMARASLGIVRKWSNERVQWGAPVGQHEAITSKIARMTATTFAMDAVTWMTSALADRGQADIRLEAAMAKLYCTEAAWRIADDTVQIRGGRGYETSESLRGRGEEGIPVERMMRDTRINLIIEGTSEIMRLFIAREAMDPHLRNILPLMSGRTPIGEKLTKGLSVTWKYGLWYPGLWVGGGSRPELPSRLSGHAGAVNGSARRLARGLFHAMAAHQQGLEKRQRILERYVNIGTELFAMSCVLTYAASLVKAAPSDRTPEELADVYCREARRRIRSEFASQSDNDDRLIYRTGRSALEGRYTWLEKDVL